MRVVTLVLSAFVRINPLFSALVETVVSFAFRRIKAEATQHG